MVNPARQAPTAAQMYEAARALRRELTNQLDTQTELRDDLQRQMSGLAPGTTERVGLETRLKEVDGRIASLDQQLTVANQRVADAAAIPGAIVPPAPPPPRSGPPDEVFVLGGMFVFFVMMPLAIGYARRLWKRSATAVAELPREWGERFTRLEQAVDAVAIELERVGEGQRFVTNLMAEQSQHALGAVPARPLEVRQREAVQQVRP